MKRLIFAFILILASISMVNSVRSIYSLWKKQDVLLTTKHELEKDKKRNQELKKQLQIASSQEFVEEQARDRLFMVKDGESSVYIPRELLATESANMQSEIHKSTWQQWWELFFR